MHKQLFCAALLLLADRATADPRWTAWSGGPGAGIHVRGIANAPTPAHVAQLDAARGDYSEVRVYENDRLLACLKVGRLKVGKKPVG